MIGLHQAWIIQQEPLITVTLWGVAAATGDGEVLHVDCAAPLTWNLNIVPALQIPLFTYFGINVLNSDNIWYSPSRPKQSVPIKDIIWVEQDLLMFKRVSSRYSGGAGPGMFPVFLRWNLEAVSFLIIDYTILFFLIDFEPS